MKFFNIAKILILCALLVSCATGANSQILQAGKRNFAAGEFKTSFHQLLPLASEGNADAQYAVGYMYYYGFGVAQDAESGIFWMEKAAAKHNPRAEKALQLIHSGD